MSETNFNPAPAEATPSYEGVNALVLGIGGAGCKVVDVLSHTPCEGIEYIALDSDAQCLRRLERCKSFQIGQKILHGFGAGASCEVARMVAEAEMGTLRQMVCGRSVLFIILGLGGGMGGGVAPLVAQMAAEENVFSIVLSIYPFDCEGTDRAMRAKRAQDEILEQAHLVVSLPNQLLTIQSENSANFAELYERSNRVIAQAVRSIWLSLFYPGGLPLDMGLLRRAFPVGASGGAGSLSIATAAGPGRMETIWNEFAKDPWLRSGTVLRSAGKVLAIFVGSDDFSHSEVEDFRKRLNSENPGAKVVLGVCEAPQGELGRVSVVLVTHPMRRIPQTSEGKQEDPQEELEALNEVDNELVQKERPPTRRVPPAPSLTENQLKYLEAQTPRLSRRNRRGYDNPNQGMLDLQITSVGRFDSCEKTFFNGQQLDVPTFIRLKYNLE